MVVQSPLHKERVCWDFRQEWKNEEKSKQNNTSVHNLHVLTNKKLKYNFSNETEKYTKFNMLKILFLLNTMGQDCKNEELSINICLTGMFLWLGRNSALINLSAFNSKEMGDNLQGGTFFVFQYISHYWQTSGMSNLTIKWKISRGIQQQVTKFKRIKITFTRHLTFHSTLIKPQREQVIIFQGLMWNLETSAIDVLTIYNSNYPRTESIFVF